MRVIVAGGTGFIGRAIVKALVDRGDEVVVATRRPREGRANVSYVTYDHLPEHADAVINLAGEWVAGLWTPAKKRAILESRVETTRRLVDWMLDAPGRMPALLNASAVGYYGNRPGEILTEESSYDPNDRFRGKVCRAWEEEASRASEFGARVVMLRIGNVLDLSGGMLGIAMPLAKRAPVLIPPSAKTITPWVSLEDTMRLILFALDHPDLAGPINITAPHPAPFGELTRELAEAMGKRSVGSIPKWLLRAVLWESSEALTDSQDVRPARALEGGFEFSHPRLCDLIRDEIAPALIGRKGIKPSLESS